MKITRIYIKNFKKFEEVTFEINSNLNIIIGENNIGKTTFFEALLLWNKCYKTNFTQKKDKLYTQSRNISFQDMYNIRIDSENDLFYDRNDHCIIDIVFQDEGNDITIGFQISRPTTVTDSFFKVDYTHSDNHEKYYKLLSKYQKNISNLFTIYYTKPVASIQAKEPYMYKPQVLEYIDRGESEKVLRNKIISKNNMEKLQSDISDILESRIAFKEVSTDRTNIKLHVQNEWGQSNILSQGSGFIQICDIFSTIEYIDSHLFIVLLDEPDAHLHSKLQKKLMDKFSELKNSQMFIITHNHHLLDHANEDEIIHLSKTALNSKQVKVLPAGGKMLVLNDVVDDISDIVKLRESSHILFVEGYQDYRFFTELISNYLKKNGHSDSVFCYKIFGIDRFDKNALVKTLKQINDFRSTGVKVYMIRDNDFSVDESKNQAMNVVNKVWDNIKLISDFDIYHHQGYCLESILVSNREYIIKNIIRYGDNLDYNDVSMKYDKVIENFKLEVSDHSSNITKYQKQFTEQMNKRANNAVFSMQHELNDFLVEKTDYRYLLTKSDSKRILKEIMEELNQDNIEFFKGSIFKSLVSNISNDYHLIDIESSFPFIREIFSK